MSTAPPPDPAALRALALLQAGQPAAARAALPAVAGPLGDLVDGLAALQLGLLDEAGPPLQRAAAALPAQVAAWRGLGALRARQRDWPAAAAAWARAAGLEPRAADAWRELGHAALYNNDADAAVAAFGRALALQPGDLALRWLDARTLPILYADGAALAPWRSRYLGRLRALQRAAPVDPDAALALLEASWDAFHLHYQGLPLVDEQGALGGLLATLAARGAEPRLPPAPARAPGPLRVGLASSLWRGHTISALFSGWITGLQRHGLRVVLVQLTDSPDAESARLEGIADEVLRVPVSPCLPAAAAIRAAGLDALIYPELGMDRRTLRLAALRLAPLQLVSWGHPVTTGLPTIDGFLSSAAMEPPDGDAHYTERLVRLPGLGLNPTMPRPGPPALDRPALGLDPDAAVLLVPQSPFKLLPQHDRLLARCVAAVAAAGARPQLVLLASELAQASRGVKDTLLLRLSAAFRAEGLAVDQHLRLLPGLSHGDYLALNQHADVFLDAPGWSGGRTTLDALCCGLVPVTLPGRLMRQRHTAAILRLCGRPETIAEDEDQYVQLVVRLATDRAWRATLAADLQPAARALAADPAGVDALADLLQRPGAWGLAPVRGPG